jgi:sarcosine/dimethylglycine N-methyltransferase
MKVMIPVLIASLVAALPVASVAQAQSGQAGGAPASARTRATSFLLTADATRAAIEQAGFLTVAWQDETEAAKAWVTQLRASGPPPSPNLGVVLEPEFAQFNFNLGRNLMEGRLGVLTVVFEAA